MFLSQTNQLPLKSYLKPVVLLFKISAKFAKCINPIVLIVTQVQHGVRKNVTPFMLEKSYCHHYKF